MMLDITPWLDIVSTSIREVEASKEWEPLKAAWKRIIRPPKGGHRGS